LPGRFALNQVIFARTAQAARKRQNKHEQHRKLNVIWFTGLGITMVMGVLTAVTGFCHPAPVMPITVRTMQ
jgi:hypothetical protein